MEFLAYPEDYKTFKEVKKVVARYVARSRTEYQKILDRFLELTGKKDPTSSKIIGYRTRIVHIGEKIEDIVETDDDLKLLFLELHSYVKAMLDHMISYSHLDLSEYRKERDRLGPFADGQ